MKKVFVNGYGSIGSRIIQFIKDDPEIEVVGVGKYSPDSKVNDAIEKGFKVYVPEKNQNAFSDFNISGNPRGKVCGAAGISFPAGLRFWKECSVLLSASGAVYTA